MRTVIIFTLFSSLIAHPAHAQDRDNEGRSLTKIVIGAAALAVGVAVAAKSSQTTTVTSAAGSSETSTFSTSQLVTGVAVAGVGGIVLWVVSVRTASNAHGKRLATAVRPAD